MNVLDLPEYIIAIEQAIKDINYGDINFELKKVDGRVVSMKVIKTRDVKFKNGDNREPLMLIADGVRNLPEDLRCSILCRYESENGHIKKLSIISEERRLFGVDKTQEV